MSGIIVLLIIKVFGQKNFSVIKLSVSIFGLYTGCKIYAVSRKPIRLPEINNDIDKGNDNDNFNDSDNC